MQADNARIDHHPAGMDDQDIIDLLELQRLTRELLDQQGPDGIEDRNAYERFAV